jgi:hypothetical protein
MKLKWMNEAEWKEAEYEEDLPMAKWKWYHWAMVLFEIGFLTAFYTTIIYLGVVGAI